MRHLFILNDPPYGTERVYNALRLAQTLARQDSHEITVFLMADAVLGARAGQKPPHGHYNVELMLKRVAADGRVLLCGTCMDARGLPADQMMEGAARSTMEELAQAIVAADRVLVF
jgi:uncharacterized protein involved in oxidation of intracellular sulfur